MDIELTNIEKLNDLENFSNFRIFGIGKLSKKQKEKRDTKKELREEYGKGSDYRQAKKATKKAGWDTSALKAGAEAGTGAGTDTSTGTDTGTDKYYGSEPEKKFLGMKRGIGIPVAIVGGLIVLGGLTLLVIKFVKK